MKLLFALMISCFIQNLNATELTAHNGMIDLRNWDFAKSGVVELNGKWEFYPWKYCNPVEFLSSNLPRAEYVSVPASWTKYSSGKNKMPVFGYATYRLTIILDSKKFHGTRELAFGMPDMFSAYKLWIDTTLAMAVGTPGKSFNEHKPKIVPVTIPLFAQRDTIAITIQIANYFFPQFAGIPRPIKLGLNQQIIKATWLHDIGYIGGAIFSFTLGIYFFFLSSFKRERKINLLFAITCLFGVLRYLFDRALIIMLFFPDFDPRLRLKFLFLSIDFNALLLWTAYLFFPDLISRKIVRTSLVLFTLYTFVVLLTPLQLGGRLFLYFVALSILICLYVTVVSGFAYSRKRESAAIFFYGTMFATVIFTNNMFVTFVHTADQYYIPIESLLYLPLVASAITLRMAHSREREIQLSSDIQVMNKNLEQLVAERTEDLHAANESLKKLNSSKDRFISILSHDLRNPLYNLIGLSCRLMKSAGLLDREKVTDYARIINDSAVAGYKLVENLLDWSLIESGSKDAVPQRLILKNIIDDAFDLLKSEAEEKGIELINDVDYGCEVFADPKMTAGILRNLLTNGIKFTHKGGKVQVSAALTDKFYGISVKDNGVGMETHEAEQLFRIDKKVYNTGTNDEPGSGYGLILSKEFVECNGGTISISSEKEKGTTVLFTLPAYIT